MPEQTSTRAPRELIRVAMSLAALALGGAAYLTIQTAHDLFIYRITLLLLFFSISTISGLIFTSNSSLSGDLKGVSIAVGGPAALWLIALVIFAWFYPEADLKKEATLKSVTQEYWTRQQQDGWQDYKEWKKDRGDFSDILGRGESTTLRNLLGSVAFRSAGQRLEQVEIATAFLYFNPKFTMKFQRIRGKLPNESFTLNYGAQTSNATGTSGSVLLVGRNNGSLHVKDSYFDGESGPEQVIKQAQLDCLIVSWYDDEVTPDGDYLTVDLKQFASRHRGSLRLGVAAFKPMREIHSWWLGSRIVNEEDDLLPLAFKEMHQVSQHDLQAVEGDLQPWLLVLDQAMEPGVGQFGGKAREMLQKALAIASQTGGATSHAIKPSAILNDPALKDRRSVSMPESEDVVLSMFLWKT